MKKVHNFSAGPGILPAEVMKQASEACINFNDLNLSLLEISHRSKDFEAVMDEARNTIRELFGVNEDYSVLYLGGGASLQFGMIPYNLLRSNGKAAYLNTGVWATKAIKEAKMLGDTVVVASSEDKNFNYIPKNYTIPADADYFHLTSNNTIYGTQIKQFPNSPVPMVCDMSSDIFSRKVDGNKFGMIYAGAQKNMGPAGTTMVMIHKDLVGKSDRKKLSMMDYAVHIKGESMYNTPPVFPIYVTLLTLRWLKKNGGVQWIEKVNQEKADLLYNEIDRNSLFYGTAEKEDRSTMNICFLLHKTELEPEFDKLWKEANISGIRGHRDVGGYRASTYNAMPIESVKALVEVMQAFEKKFA
ncbi:MAG TPA: 3-phosphoserine/phosphohydroxythreonine transaminase [Flavobacteriales bacterium]|nr:3-phosphoserine/phosphohydroxythreonine transaminase [Flavobacteriales bacterium]HRJ34429.1 3-phosphoserine/phosphohydroxythreonine transaminase [Flavobacteriales bacterium]HRJ38267.1 3-phosphoserine/phosphohydroxythreonine transaminase [Flavobacteriales bacterium]